MRRSNPAAWFLPRQLTIAALRVERRRIVERSTTATDSMDGVETGWTEPHLTRSAGPKRTKITTLPK
jgi:hypothetical protein